MNHMTIHDQILWSSDVMLRTESPGHRETGLQPIPRAESKPYSPSPPLTKPHD